ncbi:MAG: hypothetical protein ACYCZM_11955 [Acidimicrobiales bacterium]
MPGAEGLFGGGGVARQFLIYGVGYEIARSLLQPLFVAISTTEWEKAIAAGDTKVYQPLSPTSLADMLIKGIVDDPFAKGEAAKWGIRPQDLDRMHLDHGEPPPLMLILELFRRGYLPWSAGAIPAISAENAIKEGRIRDEWIEVLKRSQFTPPSVANAVEAVIRNQISRTEGIALAYFAGLGTSSLSVPAGADTTDTETAFQVLYDTAGRPPAPTQLAELVWRGIIGVHGRGPTETTFEQGIYEGDLKDKWEKPLEAILTKYPALYEIRVLLEHGAISPEQARTYLLKQGYLPDVATALAQDATAQAIVIDRILTEGNLKALYQNGTITETQALTMLTNIGYPATAAKFIIASWDLDVAWKAMTSSVTKVGTYYIGHKITATQAAENLRRLGVPESQIAPTIKDWTVSLTSNLKLLTESQIADAWEYGVVSETEALVELEAIGYTPYDAWVVLSVKNKGPLPGKPPRTLASLATM